MAGVLRPPFVGQVSFFRISFSKAAVKRGHLTSKRTNYEVVVLTAISPRKLVRLQTGCLSFVLGPREFVRWFIWVIAVIINITEILYQFTVQIKVSHSVRDFLKKRKTWHLRSKVPWTYSAYWPKLEKRTWKIHPCNRLGLIRHILPAIGAPDELKQILCGNGPFLFRYCSQMLYRSFQYVCKFTTLYVSLFWKSGSSTTCGHCHYFFFEYYNMIWLDIFKTKLFSHLSRKVKSISDRKDLINKGLFPGGTDYASERSWTVAYFIHL